MKKKCKYKEYRLAHPETGGVDRHGCGHKEWYFCYICNQGHCSACDKGQPAIYPKIMGKSYVYDPISHMYVSEKLLNEDKNV